MRKYLKQLNFEINKRLKQGGSKDILFEMINELAKIEQIIDDYNDYLVEEFEGYASTIDTIDFEFGEDYGISHTTIEDSDYTLDTTFSINNQDDGIVIFNDVLINDELVKRDIIPLHEFYDIFVFQNNAYYDEVETYNSMQAYEDDKIKGEF